MLDVQVAAGLIAERGAELTEVAIQANPEVAASAAS
jgi:hypothetical protein